MGRRALAPARRVFPIVAGVAVALVGASCSPSNDALIPGVLDRGKGVVLVTAPEEWAPFRAVIDDEVTTEAGKRCSTRWSLVFRSHLDWQIVAATPPAPSDLTGCPFVAYGEQRGDRAWFGWRDAVFHEDGKLHDEIESEMNGRAVPPHPLLAVAYDKVPAGDYLGAETLWQRGRPVFVTERWLVGCRDDAVPGCRTGTAVRVSRYGIGPLGALPTRLEESDPSGWRRSARIATLKIGERRLEI